MNDGRAPQDDAARPRSADGAHILCSLFQPRSIAVIGASGRDGRPGREALRSLDAVGFAGQVYPVTPNYGEIGGRRCVPDVESIGEPVDLAVIAGATERMEAELLRCVRAGARSALVFAQALMKDDGDPPILARITAMAREAKLPLLGPYTIGYVNFARRAAGSWVPPPRPMQGGVAAIIQSGSTYASVLGVEPRVRFSLTVHPGQEAVLTLADIADYALSLPETKVIGLFAETVRDPHGFVAMLERASRLDVPVVILKLGRSASGARFVESHAGRLAGSTAAFDAICRRHGVILASTMDEWWSTVLLLSHVPHIGPGGIAAVTDSGGQRALLADHAETIGLPWARIGEATKARLAKRLAYGLPAVNPVDAWAGEPDWADVFTECLEAVGDDPDSAIACLATDFGMSDTDPVSLGLADVCVKVAKNAKKPVVAITFASRQFSPAAIERIAAGGVAVLDGGYTALKSLKNLLELRDFRARPTEAAPGGADPVAIARWRQRFKEPETLGESESLALLKDFGIATIRTAQATNEAEAVAQADLLGYPVVLKTAEGIAHKSERKGVHLDLKDRDAVRAAYRDLAARLGPRVLVAAMASRGVEIALGIVRDRQFGALVMAGAGGELVEVLDDHAFALAPLGAEAARRLIEGLRVARLLHGVRGRAPGNIAALAETISRLSVLGQALSDRIEEIDVNPIIVTPGGCLVVDALVAIRPDGGDYPRARSA